MQFSDRYKFSNWPNKEIPLVAAGIYAIWNGDELFYCGMSGREIEKNLHKKKYDHLDYQYVLVDSSAEAYAVEIKARNGELFGQKPRLNPIGI